MNLILVGYWTPITGCLLPNVLWLHTKVIFKVLMSTFFTEHLNLKDEATTWFSNAGQITPSNGVQYYRNKYLKFKLPWTEAFVRIGVVTLLVRKVPFCYGYLRFCNIFRRPNQNLEPDDSSPHSHILFRVVTNLLSYTH